MMQSRLFENQNTFRTGTRKYGSSQHYHLVSPAYPYGSSRMVQSTMTDMLATVSNSCIQRIFMRCWSFVLLEVTMVVCKKRNDLKKKLTMLIGNVGGLCCKRE